MRIRHASWCASIVLLIGALTAAEAAGPLTPFTPVAWMSVGSPAYDLVINGDFAYVGTYRGLSIVDLSPLRRTSPGLPVLRGSVNLGLRTLGVAFNACGTGYPTSCVPHVYVANLGRDLQIINVSDPDHPVLVATKLLPGGCWDIAMKDDRPSGGPLIAYVANFGGEVYVIDVSVPATPVVKKTLGLNAWGNPAHDLANLNRLNAYATGGGGKVTSVAVSGDHLGIVEWAQGRFYYYTVTDAENPRFAGTHYAPFLFRVKIAGQYAYSLSAFGGTSGIYSIPLDDLEPTFSTRHATCANCGYFHTTGTDFGGLNISANGRYVMYFAGKNPTVVQVLDVTDPTDIRDAGSVITPVPYAGTARPLGLAQYGDYIIVAGATVGVGVLKYPGISAP